MKGLILDDDYELQVILKHDTDGKITQGAILADTTAQVQEIIIRSAKGEIKEAPKKGVGILEYIDDDSDENMVRSIRTELVNEGMKVNSLEIDSSNNLIIDAYYE